jgi:hypothetical protein
MITLFEEFENKKDSYTLYHSTNSEFFKEPESDRDERHYNPLGQGLYFSSIKSYSKKFGKNTFVYSLPKNSNILFINKSNYKLHLTNIIKDLLLGLDLVWNDVIGLWNLVSDCYINKGDPPIGYLNGFTRFLYREVVNGYKEIELQDLMEVVVDDINSQYDAIWYEKDLYRGKEDEIIIPFNKFKSEFFQNKLNENINESKNNYPTKVYHGSSIEHSFEGIGEITNGTFFSEYDYFAAEYMGEWKGVKDGKLYEVILRPDLNLFNTRNLDDCKKLMKVFSKLEDDIELYGDDDDEYIIDTPEKLYNFDETWFALENEPGLLKWLEERYDGVVLLENGVTNVLIFNPVKDKIISYQKIEG